MCQPVRRRVVPDQPSQKATGARISSLERVHNTDPAVTLNNITDPRPRLSVALSFVLEPMRNAWEGYAHVDPKSYQYVARLALCGWTVASAKCDRLSGQI